MKFLFISLVLTITFKSNIVSAKETALLISIDKQGVGPTEIQLAIDELEHIEETTGACFIKTEVEQYIDYIALLGDLDAPYYGVAIVKMYWECDQVAKDFLDQIEQSLKYTLYSNVMIEPDPAASGSN